MYVVIGGGLALNETGFILVQAMYPMSSASRSVTIPEPRCSKLDVGLQTNGSTMGGTRGPVGLWTEGPRVTGDPTCAEYSSVCSV